MVATIEPITDEQSTRPEVQVITEDWTGIIGIETSRWQGDSRNPYDVETVLKEAYAGVTANEHL
jgi:hypothetical protein